jgi:alpha-tubulin suppressor-like RCC1 family protein
MQKLAWWCLGLAVLTACVPPYVAPTRDTGVVNDLVSDAPFTDAGDVQDVVDGATGNDLGDDRSSTPDVPVPVDVPDVQDAPDDAPTVRDVPDVSEGGDASDVQDVSDVPQDVPCPSGQTPCGDGTCIDPNFSDAHCGGCGRPACAAGRVCRVGRCVVSPTDLALGQQFSCARVRGACAGVYCWGRDTLCALGIRASSEATPDGGYVCGADGGAADGGTFSCGSFSDRNTPERLPFFGDGTSVVQLAAGWYHACAIVDDPELHGTVYCWGYNEQGQLGDCTVTNRGAPVRVTLPRRRAVQVAAGARHTCAVLEGGELYCWGANFESQLGDNLRPSPDCASTVSGIGSGACVPLPRQVRDLGPVSQVAADENTTCALLSVGSVVCWGANMAREFGRVAPSDGRHRTAVTGVDDAVQIVMGGDTVCALRGRDGAVLCWGGNTLCGLGRITSTASETPTEVSGLTGVQQLAATYIHFCALRGGTAPLACWGFNDTGALGCTSPTSVTCAAPPQQGVASPCATQGLPAGRTVREVAAGGYHSCATLDNGEVWCWGSLDAGQLGRTLAGGAPASTARFCAGM